MRGIAFPIAIILENFRTKVSNVLSFAASLDNMFDKNQALSDNVRLLTDIAMETESVFLIKLSKN